MSVHLILVRHAHAEEKAPSGRDFDRRLDPRGSAEARLAAEHLDHRALYPDVVIASPARRTRETALVLSEVLGLGDDQVTFAEEMYEASVEALAGAISGHAGSSKVVLVVAHNPAVSQLAQRLTGQTSLELQTAESVSLVLESGSYGDLLQQSASVVDRKIVTAPAGLDPKTFRKNP